MCAREASRAAFAIASQLHCHGVGTHHVTIAVTTVLERRAARLAAHSALRAASGSAGTVEWQWPSACAEHVPPNILKVRRKVCKMPNIFARKVREKSVGLGQVCSFMAHINVTMDGTRAQYGCTSSKRTKISSAQTLSYPDTGRYSGTVLEQHFTTTRHVQHVGLGLGGAALMLGWRCGVDLGLVVTGPRQGSVRRNRQNLASACYEHVHQGASSNGQNFLKPTP